MLLYKEPMHGFSIYKRLIDSEFMDYSGVDPSGLYRMLKKMESEGILASSLDIQTSAQPSIRRIYEITEDGRECLMLWRKTLKEYANTIGRLSGLLEEMLEGGKERACDNNMK